MKKIYSSPAIKERKMSMKYFMSTTSITPTRSLLQTKSLVISTTFEESALKASEGLSGAFVLSLKNYSSASGFRFRIILTTLITSDTLMAWSALRSAFSKTKVCTSFPRM